MSKAVRLQIPAKHYGGPQTPKRIVIHVMQWTERSTTAVDCARMFQRSIVPVSAHYTVDAGTIVECVDPRRMAWHARGGNTGSIGIELSGFSEQTPAQWSDWYSIATIGNAGDLVRELCDRFKIPKMRIGPSALRGGCPGITGHADVSRAFGGDHWDPGPNFPWNQFMAIVNQTPVEDVVTPDDIKAIAAAAATEVHNRFRYTAPDGRELNLQEAIEQLLAHAK